MRLRRRLIATMIVLVALGLAAVDLITLTSLHSYLYGRVDDQLNVASRLLTPFLSRAEARGLGVTSATIQTRVSPDLYVEILDPHNAVLVARPSRTSDQLDPAPRLPAHLPVRPAPDPDRPGRRDHVYRPRSGTITVGSALPAGPEYRLQATSLAGETLVVATPLDSVEATLASLRNIEVAVSIGLLVALFVLMTILIRVGLKPLEDMTKEADAIAAGDLTRRLQPTDGEGEVARLGRALNAMLAQIETAMAQRAESEERLRSFLADASHELRTPLTSIRGYAELLRREVLADQPSRDRALSRIEREAARMGALVGDLAVLAREGEGREPTRYRVDLSAVAADAVADARAVDADRPIELSTEGEVAVAGESARLEQLVHNLIGNALAHTPAGTPVNVRVAVDAGEAVLEVADQGPGMTAEQAAHVFDRFYRGDAARLDGGSGLGLFIVARLAHTFGGRVSVDTDLGTGSTFQVVLPLYDADRRRVERPDDRPRRTEPDNQRGAGRGNERGAEREKEDAGID
ncbi:MAG TPA: HAMP domain-containing sensor histidine kinase [Acidimicrobiales bacterium]|jgi:two-component system OmpR family sensor kinase|nr:HAMP domain-containing sensor histidine kinase [Acidimicrobiales bacterium]